MLWNVAAFMVSIVGFLAVTSGVSEKLYRAIH